MARSGPVPFPRLEKRQAKTKFVRARKSHRVRLCEFHSTAENPSWLRGDFEIHLESSFRRKETYLRPITVTTIAAAVRFGVHPICFGKWRLALGMVGLIFRETGRLPKMIFVRPALSR